MTESKIYFISFLTLGLLEFACIFYGFSKYFDNPFLITHAKYYVNSDDKIVDDIAFLSYDVIFVALLIYGAISGLVYLFKAILLIAVFIYFKLNKGLEEDTEEATPDQNSSKSSSH